MQQPPDQRPSGPGSPAQEHPGEDSVSRSPVNLAPEESLGYWTPERMAEAKPREIVLPDPEASDPDDPDPAGPDSP